MDTVPYFFDSVTIGAGATIVMDAWMLARRRLLGTALPDYSLVGRWIGHMARGQFRHQRISASPSVRGERGIGWATHYAIGIAFAALLIAICGSGWARQPTLLPALAFGIATVAAPFFLMQPAMGAGVAASRTPDPARARVQSITTHAVFGLGLYVAARVLNAFFT
jgi:hypothetical protein